MALSPQSTVLQELYRPSGTVVVLNPMDSWLVHTFELNNKATSSCVTSFFFLLGSEGSIQHTVEDIEAPSKRPPKHTQQCPCAAKHTNQTHASLAVIYSNIEQLTCKQILHQLCSFKALTAIEWMGFQLNS